MSEESTAAANVAPPTTTTAPAKVDPPKDDDKNPAWLGPRLERERKSLLKELGIEDPEAAKAAIKAAAEAAEAKKTSEERAVQALAKLNTVEAERNRQLETLKEHAARMIGVLTQKQQDAVRAIAGDDPAMQLKTIGTLSEVWSKEEAAARPATTAPPAAAPAAVVAGAPPNHKQEYQTLRAKNPFEAAAYGLKYEVEVYKP